MLDKPAAEAIAKKLQATITPGRDHDLAIIRYADRRIASFGIRRGRKGQGHDYIPSQIFVTNKQAVLLAQCPMRYEEWVTLMKSKGKIPGDSTVVTSGGVI